MLKLRVGQSSTDPITVWERGMGICGICDAPVERTEFEVDHIVPLARGGNHTYANCQPAHQFCNRSKGARLPQEYAKETA